MELCDAKMRQLLAIEQTLSAACKQIRALLASPSPRAHDPKFTELRNLMLQLEVADGNRRARTTPASVGGFVYCIEDSGSGHHKVGKTLHKPATRFGSLQGSTPSPLFLKFAIKARDMNKAERDIHHQLRHHRLRGEWFACPLEEIYRAFRQVDAEYWSDLQGNPVAMGEVLAHLESIGGAA
jgi:hypothetical protein